MNVQDLDYPYPSDLIATSPQEPCRILWVDSEQHPVEVTRNHLYREIFRPGDLLVINDTKVQPVRVFAEDGTEILFARQISDIEWEVLAPVREKPLGYLFRLPGGVGAELLAKGLPQRVRTTEALPSDYFQKHGEYALPPYIQRARGERHWREADEGWYQTAWAANAGSSAAPTASLHFKRDDLAVLQSLGIQVVTLTLHVGIGTFLPIKSNHLNDHKMHGEEVFIPASTLTAMDETQTRGGRVWALGTTVARSLESWAANELTATAQGVHGEARIFIQPGYQWRVVQGLLTNFHQPKSTLLALVASFAGLLEVKRAYSFAIENRFRLFSYGDLSVWRKK